MMENRPTIEGKLLEESDIGRPVWYVPNHAKEGDFSQWENGILSSFRIDSEGKPAIFIRYKSACGARTNPENLSWRPLLIEENAYNKLKQKHGENEQEIIKEYWGQK